MNIKAAFLEKATKWVVGGDLYRHSVFVNIALEVAYLVILNNKG